jgi:hypothetical protein
VGLPFPAQSDIDKVDEAYVVLQAEVAPDGYPTDVFVLRDPGHGFGAAARRCAMLKKYIPGRDANGAPVAAETAPFRIHYLRAAPAGE